VLCEFIYSLYACLEGVMRYLSWIGFVKRRHESDNFLYSWYIVYIVYSGFSKSLLMHYSTIHIYDCEKSRDARCDYERKKN
jgi:hypothetical protein